MRPFYILDPDLRSGFSHNLTATKRVCRAARASGYDVTCIVNRKFSHDNTELDTVCSDVQRIWPTFALNIEDDPETDLPLQYHPVFDADLQGWEKYLYGLLSLHATLKAPQDTVFYIHTLSAPGVMGILQYLLSIPVHQRPRIHALIYCTPEIIQGERLDGVATLSVLERLRDEGLLACDLLIHVETAGLQAHYAALGFDFPICMGPLEVLEPQADTLAVQPSRPKRIVYVGEARAEKGYDRLPVIVAAIQSAYAGDLEFVIQSYTNVTNTSPAITQAKQQLALMDGRPHPIALPEELDQDAFLDTIDSADLVLMPYDQAAYRTRGSGVVYDAISRRVPVVCTPGTDMIGTFAGMGVFSPDANTPVGFAATIAAILTGSTPFPDAAIAQFGIDRFIATLTGLHAPAPHPAAPDIPAPLVCYMPALPLDGGHGFVQRAHLRMLSHLDTDTAIIGLPWANIIDGLAYFKTDTVQRYFDDTVYDGKPLYFVSLNDTETFQRVFEDYHKKRIELFHEATFEDLVRDYISFGPVLQAFLALRTPQAVVANYTWSAPVVQRLKTLTGALTICEVHDFQAQQNIYRRKTRAVDLIAELEADHAEEVFLAAIENPPVVVPPLSLPPIPPEPSFRRGFDAEAAGEAATLHNFDRTVFISRTLREDLEHYGGPQGDVIYPPNATLPPDTAFDMDRTDLLGGDHLARLFPAHLSHTPSRAIDVVFVGTAHAANITSLRFFLDDVLPQLSGPLNVFIVGNIDRGFKEEEIAVLLARGVHFMGRVASVTDWYLAAKVVLLPVIEGTGFPTKVIEALSLGQCFSAMAGAFYELSEQIGDAFFVSHDAGEMARDITALLADPQARKARGADGAAFYDRIFGFDNYLARWSDVLSLPVAGRVDQRALPHVECPDAVDRMLNHAAIPLDGQAYFLAAQTTGLGGDFSHPEAEYRWIDGTTAHLFLRAPQKPVQVTGVFVGIKLSSGRGRVTVLANGAVLGHMTATTDMQTHYLRFAAPLTVINALTLTLIVPRGPQHGKDPRHLSALLSYIRIETQPVADPDSGDITLHHVAPGHLAWHAEHAPEGPHPALGLHYAFRWIGTQGLTLTYTPPPPEGATDPAAPVFLQIDGFTTLPHQSLVMQADGQVVARLPIAGQGGGAAVPFTRIVQLFAGTITLLPARTRRFDAPDGRSAGFAVTGMQVFGLGGAASTLDPAACLTADVQHSLA